MLVTAQNFHRHTLSAPPRLFASECAPPDRECPSSQKIFPTQSLCTPALLTQPQRRNTDVRGRSYHVLKLFTPRPGQIRPDSEIRPDLVEWGVNGRLTPYATSHVESVTFPSSHRKNIRPEGETEGRARPVGPAGPASRREVSLLFEYQSHTSGRITLARPAVALWRSGRGALRRQRGRGFESGCGGCGGGESGSAALEVQSVCVDGRKRVCGHGEDVEDCE